MIEWTPTRVEKLLALRAEGRSRRLIAIMLGTTLCSVIAKLARVKHGGSNRRIGPDPKWVRKDRYSIPVRVGQQVRVTIPLHAGLWEVGPRTADSGPAAPIDFDLPDPAPSARISMLALTDATCRFPLGETNEPDFGFCGRASQPDKVYCPTHYARCHKNY